MESNDRGHATATTFRSTSGVNTSSAGASRPRRMLTEETLSDHTVRAHLSPAALEAFVGQYRHEAHVAADHMAQLLAALYRFKVRLMRRMQYAAIEEPTQPGIVKSTRARLSDERAALATLNAHGFAQLNAAMRRREAVQMYIREHASVLNVDDRKQLHHTMDAVDMVVTSARTMLDEAKSVLAAYTEATRQLA